ncbi:hypothetical protein HDV57DRAFT_492418 [Trichoderma longibrachiatum]
MTYMACMQVLGLVLCFAMHDKYHIDGLQATASLLTQRRNPSKGTRSGSPSPCLSVDQCNAGRATESGTLERHRSCTQRTSHSLTTTGNPPYKPQGWIQWIHPMQPPWNRAGQKHA